MTAESLAGELQAVRKYFERTISVFEDSDSTFTPKPEMFTVAQQVYHVAQTIDWAVAGTFGDGWNMDFEQHDRESRDVQSLTEAKAAFARAMENAEVVIRSQSPETLASLFPDDDPIAPGKPRTEIISLITDHTAHHRGALTVYTRLLNKVPPMPYL